MLGRKWGEAAPRLLELPLAPRPVSAAGLVPRDRDVDETLEEVLLAGGRRPPDVFEYLVGLEVLTAPDQLETAIELRLRL